MCATTNQRRLAARLVTGAAVAVTALTLSSCGSSSPPGVSSAASAAASTSGQPADGCQLVTAKELSQAAGVQYTAIQDAGGGSFCNVTGAQVTNNFFFIVMKEGTPPDTWDAQVAIIKRDDGSETAVSGIGERAVKGAVKEFAVEAKGHIVLVTNADFNNPATASTFARSKKIAQLLISKL
jgi:hypothetical protein